MCFRLCAECECVCLEYMLFLYDRVCLQYRWAIYYIPIQADAIARWKLVESERWINCVHMPWYSRHLLQILDHMCLVHNRKPIKYNTSNYAHKTKLKWKRRNTHTHTHSHKQRNGNVNSIYYISFEIEKSPPHFAYWMPKKKRKMPMQRGWWWQRSKCNGNTRMSTTTKANSSGFRTKYSFSSRMMTTIKKSCKNSINITNERKFKFDIIWNLKFSGFCYFLLANSNNDNDTCTHYYFLALLSVCVPFLHPHLNGTATGLPIHCALSMFA